MYSGHIQIREEEVGGGQRRVYEMSPGHPLSGGLLLPSWNVNPDADLHIRFSWKFARVIWQRELVPFLAAERDPIGPCSSVYPKEITKEEGQPEDR